jgi:Uncharacterized protein conserved in bacteria
MKVLFLENHPMWIHGLPNGFRDLGHDVMISGPLTEQNIPLMLDEFKPDLIGMLGWTEEHTPIKLFSIFRSVQFSGIPLFFWATEDPTHLPAFTLPTIRILHPNFVFSICPSSVEYYRSIGIKATHLDFGYHPAVHHRTEPQECFRCSVAVVANAYPQILADHPEHYRIESMNTLINPLVQNQIRVDFWGREWDKMQQYMGCDIPAEWIHGYIDYTEASKIYSSADIVIALQNFTTQMTQRTYEILGSGGFMITSDTPEIRRWFKPGKELAVSSSPQETIDLVRHYAAHPDEREQIRIQGETVVAPHSYKNRAQQVIDTLKQQGILDCRNV